MQYSDVASGFEKKYQTASNDGWTTARFIINFDDMTVAYNINGTNGMGNLPYYDPAEKKNLITNGAAFVRFEQDVSNSELILDYISIGTKYESAAVSKVTFTDADGKDNAYIKDSVITPEIEKIRVYFIGKADRDSFDSIEVTVDEFDETYSGVFDEETNSYVMTLDNYLKAKSTYNVLIPASVTGTAISGEIKTGEGKYEISSMEFFDEYGLKTNDVLSAKSFRVKIINTVGENKNVTLVCNSHSGYYLKNMFYKNFNIAKRKAELVLPVTIDAEADEVQGFLWSDMNKITPQIKEVVIKKTVSE